MGRKYKNPPIVEAIPGMQDLEEKKRIIEKLAALDAVFGMLNELILEQKEAFEEAVKRRPLF